VATSNINCLENPFGCAEIVTCAWRMVRNDDAKRRVFEISDASK
jgi:hypothetical protein